MASQASSIHDLLAGRRRGPLAAAQRAGLACLEPLYRLAVGWRNRRFDRGSPAVQRVPCPVISVGNLTTGGTGKTPMVLWLARTLCAAGKHPVVLSRGYKGQHGGPNDEALELRARAPDLPHLQGADRVGLARQAIAEYAADVLILDDGFQHRRLARDLDMVLIDATLPFGYGHVLPRGLLREPLTSLGRADWLVIHRADLVAPGELQAIQQTIAHWAPHVPSSCTRQAAEVLVNTQRHQQPLEALRSGRWYGFAAIGNPRNFQIALEQLGCELVGFQSFRDHHPYTAEDLRRVQQAAKSAGATQLVCTGKDLVKIGAAAIDGLPLWALQASLQFWAGEAELRAKVRQVVDSVHVFT